MDPLEELLLMGASSPAIKRQIAMGLRAIAFPEETMRLAVQREFRSRLRC